MKIQDQTVSAVWREHGQGFLAWSASRPSEHLFSLQASLLKQLAAELRGTDACRAFWASIPAALSGCPSESHFERYEHILAYACLHLGDRYLRTWESLSCLARARVLPLPRTQLSVLDVGSGPAPAMYAVSDFYAAIHAYGVAVGVERFQMQPELCPVERSRLMAHFFHVFSEIDGRKEGPFGVVSSDFGSFAPDEDRRKWKRCNAAEEIYDHETKEWLEFPFDGDLHDVADSLHRYQLVIFSNFLTTPEILSAFESKVEVAMRNQRPGGVCMIMGATGDRYPAIYSSIDELARKLGHTRITEIPESFQSDFRQPYIPALERFGTAVHEYIGSQIDIESLERLPRTWYPGDPIAKLRPFALRVYRKGRRGRVQGCHAQRR